jgi:putative ABC transport system substrate-binding protein
MSSHMRRREFITLLGGAAAAWPPEAGAQQRAMPLIGFLGAATPSAWSLWVAAFVQRLRELGWTDGRNVAIEYRWADGRGEREAEIAAELRLKVDVIVTGGNGATLTVKRATSGIPIVFGVAADPVGSGLVASLARPGGNVTGLSNQGTDLAGKRIDLLREVVPRLRRLAILGHIGAPAGVVEIDEATAAARMFNLEVAETRIQRAEDIGPALDAFKGRAEALYVSSPLVNANRIRIVSTALSAHLPTMFGLREYVDAGGLISYGPNYLALWRRAAEFVDKILRGTKPADIPVEQPTRFDLIVNLVTAKAIGLTIPETFLARADEVIE